MKYPCLTGFLDLQNCFHEMFKNGNPRKLCSFKYLDVYKNTSERLCRCKFCYLFHTYWDVQHCVRLQHGPEILFQTFAASIRAELKKFPDEVQDDVVILFSAHSLPLKVRLSPGLGVTGVQTNTSSLAGGQQRRSVPPRGRRYCAERHGNTGAHTSIQTGLAVKGRSEQVSCTAMISHSPSLSPSLLPPYFPLSSLLISLSLSLSPSLSRSRLDPCPGSVPKQIK